jgi:hypothetical protein
VKSAWATNPNNGSHASPGLTSCWLVLLKSKQHARETISQRCRMWKPNSHYQVGRTVGLPPCPWGASMPWWHGPPPWHSFLALTGALTSMIWSFCSTWPGAAQKRAAHFWLARIYNWIIKICPKWCRELWLGAIITILIRMWWNFQSQERLWFIGFTVKILSKNY